MTSIPGSNCVVCGKPATSFYNYSANAASGTPSNMQPVCGDHNPIKLPSFRRIAELESENARLLAALETIKLMSGSHTIMLPDTHPAGFGAIYRAACKALATPDCLTPAQAAVVERVLREPSRLPERLSPRAVPEVDDPFIEDIGG